mgnify:CR=1 FL=1
MSYMRVDNQITIHVREQSSLTSGLTLTSGSTLPSGSINEGSSAYDEIVIDNGTFVLYVVNCVFVWCTYSGRYTHFY